MGTKLMFRSCRNISEPKLDAVLSIIQSFDLRCEKELADCEIILISDKIFRSSDDTVVTVVRSIEYVP